MEKRATGRRPPGARHAFFFLQFLTLLKRRCHDNMSDGIEFEND